MVGEIGGTDEADSAELIKTINKPIVGYVCGHTAPPKKKMGHAGAIIGGADETALGKTEVLKNSGVITVDSIEGIPDALIKLKNEL